MFLLYNTTRLLFLDEEEMNKIKDLETAEIATETDAPTALLEDPTSASEDPTAKEVDPTYEPEVRTSEPVKEKKGSRKKGFQGKHKPHYCYFCKKEIMRINTHLRNVHKNDENVKAILKIKRKDVQPGRS